jgi:nicotinate-nucleotide--dimethylbenzimidazole phosphoribosyltransferase
MPIHAEISSRVRPQPKQKFVFGSIWQTRMQGDSMDKLALPVACSTWDRTSANARREVLSSGARRIGGARVGKLCDGCDGFMSSTEHNETSVAMTITGLPFDDFRALFPQLPGPDDHAASAVRRDFGRMRKPDSSLGRLEEIAEWLAAWSGRKPAVTRPLVAIFAGNHGVARNGISQRSPDETAAMVELCAAGGAAVNQICIAHDLGLKVFDLALDLPTADITEEAALDERACAATMAFGMEAVAGGADLLCIGDLGVGNSTVAAAMLAALFGGSGADWVRPVRNGGDEMTARRIAVVDRALAVHAGRLKDPLEVLRRLGGREFAAIAGAILAARIQQVPVILDGFAATAAAAVLYAMQPDALAHCLAAHVSSRPGHGEALKRMGMRPVLDLGLSHGEGTAAALAAGLVKSAALVHSGMSAALH